MHVLMDAIEPKTCRDLGFNLRANVHTVGSVIRSYNAEQVRGHRTCVSKNNVYTNWYSCTVYSCVQLCTAVCISRSKIVGGSAVYSVGEVGEVTTLPSPHPLLLTPLL